MNSDLAITQVAPHVFRVECAGRGSATNAHFTVDVRAYARNGSCTCDTFTGCCRPLLKATDKHWRCPHILAVRDWLMDHHYWDLVDRLEKIVEMPVGSRSSVDDVSG